MTDNFYVFRCKECGKWSVKQVLNLQKARFTCKFCNKTTKIRRKNEFGLVLDSRGPLCARRAGKLCAILNAEGQK